MPKGARDSGRDLGVQHSGVSSRRRISRFVFDLDLRVLALITIPTILIVIPAFRSLFAHFELRCDFRPYIHYVIDLHAGSFDPSLGSRYWTSFFPTLPRSWIRKTRWPKTVILILLPSRVPMVRGAGRTPPRKLELEINHQTNRDSHKSDLPLTLPCCAFQRRLTAPISSSFT
jgi:hypothetical protein